MSLIIDLAPDVEDRLKQEATRHGVDSPEYVRRLIEKSLPAPQNPLSALLQSWMEEDATDDPAELEAREAELQELKANLNANRAASGEEPVFP